MCGVVCWVGCVQYGLCMACSTDPLPFPKKVKIATEFQEILTQENLLDVFIQYVNFSVYVGVVCVVCVCAMFPCERTVTFPKSLTFSGRYCEIGFAILKQYQDGIYGLLQLIDVDSFGWNLPVNKVALHLIMFVQAAVICVWCMVCLVCVVVVRVYIC